MCFSSPIYQPKYIFRHSVFPLRDHNSVPAQLSSLNCNPRDHRRSRRSRWLVVFETKAFDLAKSGVFFNSRRALALAPVGILGYAEFDLDPEGPHNAIFKEVREVRCLGGRGRFHIVDYVSHPIRRRDTRPFLIE